MTPRPNCATTEAMTKNPTAPSPQVLKHFADGRDYRLMDPTVGPVLDLYASIPFAATVAACPGNDDWKNKKPVGVITIDLTDSER